MVWIGLQALLFIAPYLALVLLLAVLLAVLLVRRGTKPRTQGHSAWIWLVTSMLGAMTLTLVVFML